MSGVPAVVAVLALDPPESAFAFILVPLLHPAPPLLLRDGHRNARTQPWHTDVMCL